MFMEQRFNILMMPILSDTIPIEIPPDIFLEKLK